MKRDYEKRDVYAEVTQRFVDALKNGAAPWIKPWSEGVSNAGRPTNAVTGREYSGINVTILWTAARANGFVKDQWLTFNQASEAGGHVTRGQKGTLAILYRDVNVKRKDGAGTVLLDETGKPVLDTIKLIKGFTLFNVEQCSDLPTEILSDQREPAGPTEWDSCQKVDEMLARHEIEVKHNGDNAVYDPKGDLIRMPPRQAFVSKHGYYSTLLHETSHWTGHPTRLDRPGIAVARSTELDVYAYEELIAEIGSAFLCAEFGVRGEMRHEGYVLSWIKALENDSKAIFTSSAAAWKARCYLLGEEA